jgi:hypothetical protein
MRDVGLGVEFLLAIDPADDLAGADRLDDRRHSFQEVIACLFRFQTCIEPGDDFPQSLREGLFRSFGNFIPQKNADLVDLLPFILQHQQGADLEVGRGNVDRA